MKIYQVKISLIACLFTAFTAHSQLRAPVTNNDLRTNLERVIADFPHHLSSVRGDTLADNPQTIEFASLLDFKGAQENSIIQYKSVKPVYSWQALLIQTEEFELAEQKYRWLYNQLKVMTINMEGYSFTLSGEYGAPAESRKFCSSFFRLTPGASNLPKLKIEVSMQFEFPEWKVSLLVYEKQREDHERGDIYGD